MAKAQGNGTGAEDVEEVRTVAATMAHPFRSELIALMVVDAPLGAEELADLSGESVERVRRHLKALVEAGLVGMEGEEARRGAIKRYYAIRRAVRIDIEEDQFLSERDSRRATIGLIRRILAEAIRAASNPHLAQRTDRLVANNPGRVDARGWRELSEIHHDTLARVLGVLEESRERLKAGEEEPIGVISEQIFLEAQHHAPPPKP